MISFITNFAGGSMCALGVSSECPKVLVSDGRDLMMLVTYVVPSLVLLMVLFIVSRTQKLTKRSKPIVRFMLKFYIPLIVLSVLVATYGAYRFWASETFSMERNRDAYLKQAKEECERKQQYSTSSLSCEY